VLAGSLPHGTLNKPLQPYCINTASPIGTEILIEFVVFEQNSYPPKMSTVTRTVNIVAPCDVGFELCPQDNVCSDIDCDQRELLSSQVVETDSTPPTLRTAVPAVVEVPYGETTTFKYTVCATCGDAGCGMCAEDADDGDVSASLRVIQIKAAEDDLSCPISAVSEGQCGTGTYIYEYTAADTAGNEAMAGVLSNPGSSGRARFFISKPRSIFTLESQPDRNFGHSSGGIFKIYNSDWYVRYHNFDTKPDAEVKSEHSTDVEPANGDTRLYEHVHSPRSKVMLRSRLQCLYSMTLTDGQARGAHRVDRRGGHVVSDGRILRRGR